MDKVDWDTYFMTQCFLISMRSTDTTKHGAIIVDESNRILSCGYNGNLQGIDDSSIPTTSPEKYPYRIHAEENAILFLNNPLPENTKIYITGRPCHKCTRMIIQKGIKHIIYGPQKSKCVDLEDVKASEKMIKDKKIRVTVYDDANKLNIFTEQLYERIKNLNEMIGEENGNN